MARLMDYPGTATWELGSGFTTTLVNHRSHEDLSFLLRRHKPWHTMDRDVRKAILAVSHLMVEFDITFDEAIRKCGAVQYIGRTFTSCKKHGLLKDASLLCLMSLIRTYAFLRGRAEGRACFEYHEIETCEKVRLAIKHTWDKYNDLNKLYAICGKQVTHYLAPWNHHIHRSDFPHLDGEWESGRIQPQNYEGDISDEEFELIALREIGAPHPMKKNFIRSDLSCVTVRICPHGKVKWQAENVRAKLRHSVKQGFRLGPLADDLEHPLPRSIPSKTEEIADIDELIMLASEGNVSLARWLIIHGLSGRIYVDNSTESKGCWFRKRIAGGQPVGVAISMPIFHSVLGQLIRPPNTQDLYAPIVSGDKRLRLQRVRGGYHGIWERCERSRDLEIEGTTDVTIKDHHTLGALVPPNGHGAGSDIDSTEETS